MWEGSAASKPQILVCWRWCLVWLVTHESRWLCTSDFQWLEAESQSSEALAMGEQSVWSAIVSNPWLLHKDHRLSQVIPFLQAEQDYVVETPPKLGLKLSNKFPLYCPQDPLLLLITTVLWPQWICHHLKPSLAAKAKYSRAHSMLLAQYFSPWAGGGWDSCIKGWKLATPLSEEPH